MATSSKSQVLSLYKMLLKESKKFPSYNYRTYALRRVRDSFRENKDVSDPKAVEFLLNRAWDSLAIIQRQACNLGDIYLCHQPKKKPRCKSLAKDSKPSKVSIGKLFSAQKIVVENVEGMKKAPE